MKTMDEVYDEMRTQIESLTGTALSSGGDMDIRLRAFAYQVFSLIVQQEYVKRQMFPQTAEGEHLDHHAQMRGLERGNAVKATGTLRFSVDEAVGSDLTIASGTACMTETGAEFVTTQGGTISAGSLYCDVQAEARLAGSAGNVPAGSICYMMLAPTGVAACSNPEAFHGGTDAEDDESLRQRILSAYRTLPNGANKAYYENAALACDGVEGVVVLPKNRGRGTVDVIISASDGLPSAELVQAVSDRLDADREICVDIDVLAPASLSVNVSAQVLAGDGYSFQDISNGVEQAIAAFFNGGLLGKDVLVAEISNIIYSVEGVKNYKLVSPGADVAVEAGELPVLGTLSITEMEA